RVGEVRGGARPATRLGSAARQPRAAVAGGRGLMTLATLSRRLDAAARQIDLVQARRQPPPALTPLQLAEAAGLTPDPWQTRFLASTNPRVLLNCSRQSGKSTMTAVMAV